MIADADEGRGATERAYEAAGGDPYRALWLRVFQPAEIAAERPVKPF